MTDVARELRQIYRTEPKLARRLRALWTLHVIGAADESFLHAQLGSADAEIQAWAIRLLTERLPVSDTTAEQFTKLADSASSPLVRLYLASALQQLTLEQNWKVAARLAVHGEDAQDANLPLMIWYGIEPLVRDDLGRFLDLTCGSPIPILRRLGARRALATDASDAAMTLLLKHLASSSSDATRSDLLAGMLQALQGQRSLELPQSWPATYASLRRSSDLVVQRQAVELALIFNDPEAYRLLREQATDENESAEQRSHAIDALVARHAKSLVPLLLQLTGDPVTQRAAIRGLAAYDASEIAPTLLDLYPSLPKEVQQEVLQTLTARPAWAIALLDRIDANQISRADLTAYTIRQISSLKNDSIAARVKELWGETQETPADRKAMIAEFKQRLTSDMLAKADLSAGRFVFQAQCANCHRLYDTGGDIGPNITGSQRYNLDYLLENIIDPNAAVARDYQMQVLELESGRIITGLVLEETDRSITIQTLNEKLTLAKSEIDQRENARVSMMPDGLLQTLSPEQVRDLFGYLMGSRQVPIDR